MNTISTDQNNSKHTGKLRKLFSPIAIAIIAIVIALFGGVPGIVSTIDYFQSKPKLNVIVEGFLTCQEMAPNGNDKYQLILLTITLSNDSKSKITPYYFDLDYLANNNWFTCKKYIIPDVMSFHSDTQEIQIINPSEKDLQCREDTIVQGRPWMGFLMFVIPENIYSELNSCNEIDFRLICTDVTNRIYRSSFSLRRVLDEERPIYLPKHGVNVIPK